MNAARRGAAPPSYGGGQSAGGGWGGQQGYAQRPPSPYGALMSGGGIGPLRAIQPRPPGQLAGQSYGQSAAAPQPGAAIGAGFGQAALSDENSKTDIARLEGQNEALTKALDRSFTGSNMPATEYPKLPGNTRVAPSSSASFADTPAANTVAAQNVGLRQAAPPSPPPVQAPPPPNFQPSPQQSNFGRSTSPAFNGVGGGPPDMSELDRVYARMGQGG